MHALAQLGRNLLAGLRLALGLRVDRSAFVIGAGAWLALFMVGLALEVLLDFVVVRGPAMFDFHAPVSEGFRSAIFVLAIVMALVAMRQPGGILPVLVMSAAALPLLSVVGFVYEHWLGPRIVRMAPMSVLAWWGGTVVLLAWVWFVLARSGALALEGRRRRWLDGFLIGAAAVFAVFATLDVAPERQWFVAAPQPGPSYVSPASEDVLAKQASLLESALALAGQQQPGVSEVYFVGFGGYAQQDVFRRDLTLAMGATSLHFPDRFRSISLLNNRATPQEYPFATVTNLEKALSAVSEHMDPNEDVLVLFFTSHGGSEPTLVVENPPYQLHQLTPEKLRDILANTKIRWRIIVISACYSGGFIPVLEDDHTLIMTAAAKDRTSFGCDDRSELTFFTEALFRDSWRRDTGLLDAFAKARGIIERREKDAGLSPPSDPQIVVGEAMRRKLAELESPASKP